VFTIDCGPDIVLRWWPSGHFQTLILSEPPDAKVYSYGCRVIARTPFLWWVRVCVHDYILKSQNLIILSWLPVITWGSSLWQRIDSIVFWCPASTPTCTLVRMSQIRAVESLPPVTSRSICGCNYALKMPLRCPWYCLTTRFCSKSQHLTILSSPTENKYGERSDRQIALTVLMWPVNVSLQTPVTRSHNLMVLSALPDAKYSLCGSIARQRTQPWCPAITVFSFHGACHLGY